MHFTLSRSGASSRISASWRVDRMSIAQSGTNRIGTGPAADGRIARPATNAHPRGAHRWRARTKRSPSAWARAGRRRSRPARSIPMDRRFMGPPDLSSRERSESGHAAHTPRQDDWARLLETMGNPWWRDARPPDRHSPEHRGRRHFRNPRPRTGRAIERARQTSYLS